MFSGELDEAGREARVLIDRIAVIIAGDDLRSRFVRHGGGHFIEAHAQEIGDDVLDGLAGEELGERLEPRGVVERQAHGILARGKRRRRFFLPPVEQRLEFHRDSAIGGSR